MDSSVIKTYLLDYIFDIMENPKFRHLAFPSGLSHHGTGQSTSSSTKSVTDHNLFMVHDSLTLCLSKVYNSLCTDESLDTDRLYTEIFERCGEVANKIAFKQKKPKMVQTMPEMCYHF